MPAPPPAPAPTPTAPRTTPYTSMAGWDTRKLNDPTQGTTVKYQFGRLMQEVPWSRGNLQGVVDEFNRRYGGNARVTGEDTVDFNNGWGNIDLINAKGNYPQWVVEGAGGGGAAPKTGQAKAFALPSQHVGGGGGGGSATAGGGGGGLEGSMRDYLLQLMQRSQPGAINPLTDPNLSPQANAYSAARQNAAQREREQLAERSAFTGMNLGGQGSGAFETGLAGIQENAGRDIAGQQAELVGQEVQARRNDLLNALQIANSVGARDQAAKIQMQIANLDNAYRYKALAQNQAQFGASQAQQQGQWNDQYGLSRLGLQNDMNRYALMAAMGGGY